MIYRLKNPNTLALRAEEPDVADMIEDFDPWEWVEQGDQFTLTNGRDMVLVKQWADNVFEIHWAMRNRGQKAIAAGVDFLRHLYHKEDARIVVGTVPVLRRASRWFSRQVGGKSGGIVQTENGDAELFALTKEDFEARHGVPPQQKQV